MGYSGYPDVSAIVRSARAAARKAGLLLLLTAAANVVMVFARVMADADQDSLLESLIAIGANKGMYSLGGAARLVSGLTLLGAAVFFAQARLVLRGGFDVIEASSLFGVSGLFTAISGGCAIALAVLFAPSSPEAALLNPVDASTDITDYLRWFTGKVGFTIAGLALFAVAWRQRMEGGAWRRAALATGALGVGMQFIWIDAATIVHQIVGVAFFAWLVVVGAMLKTGKLERGFGGVG